MKSNQFDDNYYYSNMRKDSFIEEKQGSEDFKKVNDSGVLSMRTDLIGEINAIFSQSDSDNGGGRNVKNDLYNDNLSNMALAEDLLDVDPEEASYNERKKKLTKYKHNMKKTTKSKNPWYFDKIKGLFKIDIFPYYSPTTQIRILENSLPLDSSLLQNSIKEDSEFSVFGDLTQFKRISHIVHEKEAEEFTYYLEEKYYTENYKYLYNN